ncbi:LysR family transcriptional regulator [Winslowiella iniecta]|nr:LysR family transcriptional regulator [Winslowiella iniecta]
MHESIGRMSFDDLSAFIAVAETGSFRNAALRIGRDATILSRRVSHLESQLGVQLLSRTTRRVSLTEVGVIYSRRVRALLDELDSASREASNFAASAQGLLRISVPIAFGRLWVAPLLPSIMAAYPQMRFDARYIDRFVDVVAEGFDMAIRVGKLSDSTLRARKIASFKNILVASPNYLATHGTPETPADLEGHACLAFVRTYSSSDWILKKEKEKATVTPQGQLAADNSESLLIAAIHSAGIALLPDWLVSSAIKDGKLEVVMKEWQGADEGEVYAVMPPGQLTPTKTRVFVDEITTAIQNGWG